MDEAGTGMQDYEGSTRDMQPPCKFLVAGGKGSGPGCCVCLLFEGVGRDGGIDL